MEQVQNNGCNCNSRTPDVDETMVEKILSADCGCMEEYAEDYNVDEVIADEVELTAAQTAEFAGDQQLPEAEAEYHNTAEYQMVTAENARHGENRASAEDDIFNYQGS